MIGANGIAQITIPLSTNGTNIQTENGNKIHWYSLDTNSSSHIIMATLNLAADIPWKPVNIECYYDSGKRHVVLRIFRPDKPVGDNPVVEITILQLGATEYGNLQPRTP